MTLLRLHDKIKIEKGADIAMIGFYNYTVILTYLSLMISVGGLFLAADGRIDMAILCLMASGFLDLFDGIVARTKKDRTDDQKTFGIQIDSLTDVVCFGALPALIAYMTGMRAVWQILILMVFVTCDYCGIAVE